MIDFTNVMAVTIPEGSVKKITRNSVLVWEKPEQERWDNTILPYDGSADGYLPVKVLSVTVGQKVTLAYYMTKQCGYVYDGRSVGLQYFGSVSSTKYPFPSNQLGAEHQMSFIIPTAGKLVLCGYNGNTSYDGKLSPNTGDRPYGQYVKYRIEDAFASAPLPAEYQKVEWIGVSGTQWINTGISPKSENVTYECAWIETTRESSTNLFGSTSSTSSTNKWSGCHYHSAAGTLYSATGSTDGCCKLSAITSANKINSLTTQIVNNSITMTLNGMTATQTYSGSIQNGVNIALFADYKDGVMQRAKYTRMYYWKMTDNGVLVRHMIPCYRKSDNVIGMYDLVGKTFYTNAGSGTFTKGSNVT